MGLTWLSSCQHWWLQGNKRKTDGKRGALEAALCYSDLGTNALQNHAIQAKLSSAQRSVATGIISEYRTVSTSAVLVLPSVPLIDLLAGRKAGGLSASQGTYLFEQRIGNRLREGSHPQWWIDWDSSRDGRRDSIVSRSGDEHTI